VQSPTAKWQVSRLQKRTSMPCAVPTQEERCHVSYSPRDADKSLLPLQVIVSCQALLERSERNGEEAEAPPLAILDDAALSQVRIA